MYKHILIAMIVGAAGTAVAAPRQDTPSDDVSITVTAGRGRLGFAAIQISPELRAHFGAPSDRGVLVDNVRKGSPADRAGLRVGDVLLEVDGTAASSATDILDAIGGRKKGDVVTLDIERGRARMSLQATLEDDAGPRVQQMFHRFGRDFGDMPDFDRDFPADVRKMLDDMQKRMRDLEKRMDKQPKMSPDAPSA